MKILVVGATGVLGRRVVPGLIAAGHTVTGMGRSASGLAPLAKLGMAPAVADLFDTAAVRDAVRGHDAVINVATKVPPVNRMFLPGAWKDMDRVRREGSAIVADAVIAAGVPRLIQESFALTYPDSGAEWITEDVPVHPARYNRSTLDAEASAARARTNGHAAVVLRFALLYGPGDPFATQLISSAKKGWLPLLGDRHGYVPLVTQDDAASAVIAALDVPSGTYNVVDDAPLTREDIGRALGDLLGVKPPKMLPSWMAKLGGSLGATLARSLRVSNRALRTASAWSPASPSAREGLKRCL